MKITEMLDKLYGDQSSAHERATHALIRILQVMHPKFDEEWETQGYEADEEGYVDEFDWSADTLEDVARSLYMYGFGPDSCVKHELEILLMGKADG